MTIAQQAADFYVGRGPSAKYLGTITVPDAAPDALAATRRFAPDPDGEFLFEEQDYRAAVAQLIEHHGGTDVWPHKHPDSTESAYAYAFDASSVHVYEKGFQVEVIYCNRTRKQAVFPQWP